MNDLASEESRRSYYGWVVVGIVFLAQLLSFGLVYSFGVFFKPLAEQFGWSRAATAGAFSAYGFIHTLLAPVAGRIVERYGPRALTITGGFCIGLTMFLMSHVTAIWQLYLFYAVIFSIGISAIYAPLVATVSQWFTEKRGLAVGIAAAGLGAGSMVFLPLAAWLISSYGWQMAYIVVGIICWVLFIPVVIFMRQAPKKDMEAEQAQGPGRNFTAAEAFETRTFWTIGVAWFLAAIVLWGIAINIVPLLTDRGLHLVTAGTIAGVIGATSMIGRVGMGFLSDRIGRKVGILIGFSLQLIATILFLFCQELWMFFLFAVVFGFGSGTVAGIFPSLPADFFGSKATATILGFLLTFAGVGVALGPFIGGRIFDVTGSYYYLIWMCIIALLVAIIFGSLIKAPAK